MKRCPNCKKEIAEEASFCIYCMTELTEKREIPTGRNRKKRPWKKALLLGLFALAAISLFAVPIVVFRQRKEPVLKAYRFPEKEIFFSRAETAAKELGLSSYDPEREELEFRFYPDNSGIAVYLNGLSGEDEALSLTEVFSAAVYGYYPEGLKALLKTGSDGWTRVENAELLPEYALTRVRAILDPEDGSEWQFRELIPEGLSASSVMTFLRFVPEDRPDLFSAIILFLPERQ